MLRLIRRLRYVLRQRSVETNLQEELEFHRALKQHQLEESGVARAQAVQESRRALGNMTLAREDARVIWIGRVLESTWQDTRYGTRALRRNLLFTAAAVLTLALGIGAHAATARVM